MTSQVRAADEVQVLPPSLFVAYHAVRICLEMLSGTRRELLLQLFNRVISRPFGTAHPLLAQGLESVAQARPALPAPPAHSPGSLNDHGWAFSGERSTPSTIS